MELFIILLFVWLYLLRELTVDIGIAIIAVLLVVAIGLGTMEILLDD